MEQQINNLVSSKVLPELDELIAKLEETNKAFAPIMQSIRDTFNAMGGSTKDVRALIKAVELYNKTMSDGATVIRDYNSTQAQLEQARKRLVEADKQTILTTEKLKEQRAAIIAQVRQEIAAEAELAGKNKSLSTATTEATRTKISAREETRRLVQEIKRQIDVQNGTITLNGKETQTYRAKDALLKQLRERYKDVSEEVQKQLIPQIQKLDKELRKQDAAIGMGGKRAVGEYEKFGNTLSSIFPTAANIGRLGLLGAGFMGVASAVRTYYNAAKYGLQVNMQFEQSNANLAAVMGTTSRAIEMLKQQALELGRTTEYTAVQVTDAQTELAKLGFSQQTILNMTKPLLGFATALGASLPQAAEVAGQTLRAFNLPSSQTEQVLTEMTLAANKSAMDFQFLERSIAIVGASASVSKIPLKDTLALLGVLSNSGLDASRAATALRNVFLYLADDSKKLGKAMKGTEMDAGAISKAFTELRNKGVDLADMFQLTDKRAVNALAVLIQNAEQIIKLREEIQYTTGALDELRNIRLDTLQGDVTLLKSAWDAYWLSFRENMPIFREFTQGMTSLLNNLTKSREKKSFSDPTSSAYATDLIDKSAVNAAQTDAERKLASLGESYRAALSLDDNGKEADKIFKEILKVRGQLLTTYANTYEKTSLRVYKANDSIDAEFERLAEASSNKGLSLAVKRLKNEHEAVANYSKDIKTEMLLQTELQKKLQSDLTLEDRKATEKRLEISKKASENYAKSIVTAQKRVVESYDKISGFAYGSQKAPIEDLIKRAKTTERITYGRFLTAGQTFDAVKGVIEENERTLTPQGTGDFKVDNGRKKGKSEKDRKADKRRELADAEELAAYTKKINTLKDIASAEKAMSQTDLETWDAKRAGLENYIATLKDVEQLEYERATAKLMQKAAEGTGLSDRVVDSSVIDPLTGKPQTEIEKATLEQRLSLNADYKRQLTLLDIEYSKGKSKIDEDEAKSEEARIKKGLERFKAGLKQRLEDVELWGTKEKEKNAKKFNVGELNEIGLKEENAKVDVIVADKMAKQTAFYYEDFINKLNLPESLREQLKNVYAEHVKDMEKAGAEASANYETQTGKQLSRKQQQPSFWRRMFGTGIKRSSVDSKGQGGEMDESSGNKAARVGKDIQGFLSKDVVKSSADLYSQMTSIITSYYDQQIAKIDELMAKETEQYELRKTQLNEQLSHLEFNNSNGLVSEENYLAQKRKNQTEQKELDKKHAAEQEKLEKRKRKLQLESAKWEKRQAYVSAVLSTANAVANALQIWPTPVGIVFAAIAGAMGAAQIALIASQSVPQYAKGTNDHVGGGMIVGDGGVREFILEPNTNKVKVSPNVPTYMKAPKHTKVFKDDNAFLSYLSETYNSDTDGKFINVNVENTGDPEQRSLLRSLNNKVERLNANERYRIQLERNKDTFSKW